MIDSQREFLTAAVGFFLFYASVACADKLEDFTRANSAGETCERIPYSDLRSICEREGSVMHNWCDGKEGPVTCDKGASNNLKRELENERSKYEGLKSKKSTLEGESSRATDEQEKTRVKAAIDATANEIYNSDKAIDVAKDALKKREDFVDKAIYTINKCIDYRRAVRNVFDSALDKVRNENEDQIKPLAQSLRDKYEQSKRGHEIAITDKQNALSNCKDEEL